MLLRLDQMWAEVCGYLTGEKYFDLPTYRVSDLVPCPIIPFDFLEATGELDGTVLLGYFPGHMSRGDRCCNACGLEV